jgi:hypothetical protein
MVDTMKEINKVLQDARADIRRENKALIENLQASNKKFLEDMSEDSKALLDSIETEIGNPLKGPD